MRPTFTKRSASAPPGYFAWEAAGLRWLADARGGRGAAGAGGTRVGAGGAARTWGEGSDVASRGDGGAGSAASIGGAASIGDAGCDGGAGSATGTECDVRSGRAGDAGETTREGGTAAAGGARVARVVEVRADTLVLDRVTETGPTPRAAEALGRALAATHDAGAPAYGCGPPGWDGDGWLGPLSEPLPLELGASGTWGAFHARHRILVEARRGRDRDVYGASDVAVFEALASRLQSGDLDDRDDRPARLHGDLWSGNVLWAADGAVLIDPAAHGGNRETDLAMLALFGAPHLDRMLAAYDEAHPLADGWRARVALHQVHPLMLHAVLFGGGYAVRSVRAAARYV